jgi:hypothetical protein
MTEIDIEQELSEALRREIDKEILVEVRCADLISQGWTMVTIDAAMEDIGGWMQANIRGDWRAFHDRWLFEDANDAVLFKLRWM